MRSKHYVNIDSQHYNQRKTPWYWSLIALVASWLILAGYLILPGLYARQYELKFSKVVLSAFVVSLLTAGWSFTVLLCFVVHDDVFKAQSVFLPALASSALGLLSIAYNFLSSRAYVWGTAAIIGLVLSTTATVLYGFLFLWMHRRIVKRRDAHLYGQRPSNVWSEQSFYTNFLDNVYPSATATATASASASVTRAPSAYQELVSDEDRINQQMAKLLTRTRDSGSPDAATATFRIDLPEDQEEADRIANSSELVGSPPAALADRSGSWGRARRSTRDSLAEEQVWQRWDRGRTMDRPQSLDARSTHSRALSREERRREIELGRSAAPTE